jgi:hypothetical protein
MDNFFTRLLLGSHIKPARKVRISFSDRFPEALNVEWFEWEEGYEAVFYLQDREYIAHYHKTGELAELKENIKPEFFKGRISKIASAYGEVMNVIRIDKKDGNLYEIIFRTPDLVRYFLLLDAAGKELRKCKL